MDTSKIQRIKHLQLQGFTVQEAAKMQGVSVNEVFKIYNEENFYEKINKKYRIA